MSKIKLSPYEYGLGTLFICVHFGPYGPVGCKNLNPARGWVAVYYDGSRNLFDDGLHSPIFQKLKEAKKWAEERYQIHSWTKPDKNSVYKSIQAIPIGGFKKKTNEEILKEMGN